MSKAATLLAAAAARQAGAKLAPRTIPSGVIVYSRISGSCRLARTDPEAFAVLPGHERSRDEVLSRTEGLVVVRKRTITSE